MKTKLSKAPFPGKQKMAYQSIDTSKVKRCRDPYQPERVVQRHKYDELFAGLKEGDCYRVEEGGVQALSALARAMRCYMKRHGIDGIVRQSSKTDDGIPRVWLVKTIKPKLREVA